MYRVAICDDEGFFRLKMINLIKNNVSSKRIVINEYCNGEDFLEDFQSDIEFDIIFMDICMNGINGEEVVRRVRNKEKNHPVIVFITSVMSDISSIVELQPFAYIYKNRSDDYIVSKIKAVFEKVNSDHEVLEFICNRQFYRVSYSDIKYIESYRNDISIVTINYTYVTRTFSLSQINEKLSSKKMMQCCSSAIVNYDYIKAISSNKIEMIDGKVFSIGRKYKENLWNIHTV